MEQTMKRERGTGSVFTNGSNVLWIKYYWRGIAKRESTHSTDRKVAERLLKRRLAEVETKTFTPSNNIRIDELYADMVAEYKREGRKSIKHLEMRWKNHLQPFFTRLRADHLNTDLVQRYSLKRKEEEGASGPTINRELAILKRACSLARENGKLRAVPVIHMYKESTPRTGFLEDAQYMKLAAECNKEGLWLRALLTTAYSFAFRKGELLSMHRRQVDLASREIQLEAGTTKNDEARIASMTDEVFHLLSPLCIGKQPDDFLFSRPDKDGNYGANGHPVRAFRRIWKTVCTRAGVPNLMFHDLRRSGVRNLRKLGVPESVAMKISGHKTRSIFERYNIVDKNDVIDATRKLNEKQKSNAPALPDLAVFHGQSSGIVARKTGQTQTAPSLAPLPN
jgi:integrase